MKKQAGIIVAVFLVAILTAGGVFYLQQRKVEIRRHTGELYSQMTEDGRRYTLPNKQCPSLDNENCPLIDEMIVEKSQIVYGDVTGDWFEEAIVAVASGAGKDIKNGILVYSVVNKKVVLIDEIEGFQMSPLIENGKLVIHTPEFLDTDAGCCPSFHNYTTYTWDKGKFVVSATKRLSSAELNQKK